MATVKITYYYDRVGLGCHTDGEVCERGYYAPGGWHYGKHICRQCRKDAGPFPRSKADLAALTFECEAREAVDDIAKHVGHLDEVQLHADHIMVYGSENMADYTDPYHETRQAAIYGDLRVLRILALRMLPNHQRHL